MTVDTHEINQAVSRWLADRYREEHTRPGQHLPACPDMQVTVHSAADGDYDCDTGCEYLRFEATVSCPHASEEWEYGTFGELVWLLGDLFAHLDEAEEERLSQEYRASLTKSGD